MAMPDDWGRLRTYRFLHSALRSSALSVLTSSSFAICATATVMLCSVMEIYSSCNVFMMNVVDCTVHYYLA
ncbi:hypothetical protein OE88DRAFT_756143 [Heliocybe sulcata]|uniref:Uncharacterized protein n=1 Tax=Heliocybe sulcata TaxID=5364 RepID=A0A5C3N286_9AGAM|nr:hypothetical protein OE88DRAFT_756143 [Heliocybe sulcata]